MKFRPLHNWTNIEHCTPLIYFTQMVEELLFDYTHSSYKPSTMNTPSLCIEAIATIDDIEKGSISPAHITHIVEELTKNLKNDDIAKSLLKTPLGAFLDQLNESNKNIRNLKVTLELLRVQLNLISYEKRIIQELTKTITTEFDTSKIRKLTRLLITHLLTKGISQEFLTEKLKSHFFNSERQINSNNEISSFLDNIPSEQSYYSVYFSADKSFNNIISCLEQLEIQSISSPPENMSGDALFSNLDQRIILLKKIKSYDPFSARRKAEGSLKLASTLLAIYHHKQEAAWSAENIVVDENNQKITIKSSINPMHRCKDLLPQHASRRLHEFMTNFSMRKDSFNKFIRSTQLHAMALRTNAVENQILNLWIAIESLIPDESKKDDEPTIDHIVNSITPFLNINYIEILVKNLVKDMLRWDYDLTVELLRTNENQEFSISLAMLVTSEEHQVLVDNYKLQLSSYPLLKDRFEYIQKLLSSPTETIQALKNHAERIDWQIKRIYRTRNLIVHTGQTPPRTNILVEHAHDYLDTVVNCLIKLSSHPIEILSVAQGFKNIDMKYKMYMRKLEKKKQPFTPEDVEGYLFNK